MTRQSNYESDVVAWAKEQAALLRAGRFSEMDIANIAEEIEDVGKSEKRELASRMAVLLAHLLKWQFQPERQCKSWQFTLREQRKSIAQRLKDTPSLKGCLTDEKWISGVWSDALTIAVSETGLAVFPEECIWTMPQALSPEFYPD
ncbi:DUF29 domain-containing protein [Salmonella enterica subsp. enterica serovar Panama]|uniref:DUF29 domain-containing protein n=1 Tax=Salmonella enterica subsp. enterica serovar Panama TaxID=29472 RepID=A0A636GFJ1_SALET|nr:DUF29 domain-containing protein [Salmonella enterica subsp. enterica serovar Panama]EDI0274282.1 DUF29 domain-containing protein [Salmonella enterica subsp. enterica serovar Panama]